MPCLRLSLERLLKPLAPHTMGQVPRQASADHAEPWKPEVAVYLLLPFICAAFIMWSSELLWELLLSKHITAMSYLLSLVGEGVLPSQ